MTHDTNRPDGVYADLGYGPDPTRLSPNGAKKLLKTPARFDWDRKHPQKTKRVWDFGLVAHKVVLGEGDQFLVLYPEIHGLKKDGDVSANPRATAAWIEAEANARAEGLTPIHVDDYLKAVEMARAVHEHEMAGPLLATGHAERWLYWTDAESGRGLRQRLDWMTHSDGRLTIVEYKTAADASFEAFNRSVFKLGYHVPCAFAIAGAKALGLDENPAYRFVVQEKEPPYLTSVHDLEEDAFRYSCQRMREAITIYQHCMETDEWPGYPPVVNSIPLPAWAIEDEMEFSE